MSLVIEDPTTEARIHAFATARGLTPDQAILQAINAIELQDDSLSDEELARARRGIAQLDAGESLSQEDSQKWCQDELMRRFAEKESLEKAT
jgi:hypothetical protein